MPQEWFTLESLGVLATAAIALRLVVEYTKDYIDKWTDGKLPTFWYALLWAAVLVFGVDALLGKLGTNGQWFVDVFNAFLLTVTAKVMDKDDTPKVSK